ncbi:glycine cleavage system protein T [Mesorhizobium tamadayense]|uniref:Glycine cleavage system protein T n=1 Tax=Mesorhizobium tamadayense TaxID=425306 RepID=A0A3P3F4R9_9HYPH|nr:nuclear transport factor 2 family protein [Mesorhizobium tamadayense]RRH93639.1 glycine cleavage system protein T [Mesorhizobium tamadayense]
MTPTAAFQAFCNAYAAGNYDAMAALFTDDGVFDAPNIEKPAAGRDAIRKQLRILSHAQKDVSTTIRNSVDAGDKGYIEASFEAAVVGAGGKINGAQVRTDFHLVAAVEMRDGQILRLTEHFDRRPLYPEERQRMWMFNRRTPYWQKTVDAECQEWTVYNNMHFPTIYSRMPYEDYAALVEDVTLWDVGLERQTQIKGPDALAFFDYLSCRDMSKMAVGDCMYALICHDDGTLMADPVCFRPFDDTIWLSHGNADVTFWARGIAMNSKWDVDVSEPDIAPMQVQGPLAQEVLDPITEANLNDLKNYKCVVTKVAGYDAVVSRTGWSGGFGYEVLPLVSSVDGPAIWDEILKAGEPYGLKVTGPIWQRAIERGVTDFNYYMGSGINPLEDVASKFVHLDKPVDFVGKEALKKIKAAGVKRHSVGLFIEAEVPRLEWFWSLRDDKGRVGEVRWAAHSFALNRSLGIAIVDSEIKVGDRVTIETPYGKLAAEVTTIPFVSKSS